VHASTKSLVVLSVGVCSVPEVALLPDHPPEAEHAVAFCELHVSFEVPPADTVVGLAEIFTTGAPVRLTVTDFCVVPPAPVHDRV